MLSNVPPFIVCDGTHCLEGTLLSVYSYSSNRQNIALGHLYSIKNESKATWSMLFDLVLPIIGRTRPIIVITNGDKGITEALKEKESSYNVVWFNDAFHKASNIRESKIKEIYWRMVRSPNKTAYELARKELSSFTGKAEKKRVADLLGPREKNYFPIRMIEYLQSRDTCELGRTCFYSYVSSQLAESMNNANIYIRKQRPFCVFNFLLSLFQKEAERYGAQKTNALITRTETLTPNCQHLYQAYENESVDLCVEELQPGEYLVSRHCLSSLTKTKVGSDAFTCELHQYQQLLNGFPCECIFSTLNSQRKDVTKYFDDYWTNAHWSKQFQREFPYCTRDEVTALHKLRTSDRDEDAQFLMSIRNVPDHKSIERKGRPKENTRIPSVPSDFMNRKKLRKAINP
mmetsp:Transcript_14371/g.17437  ORF Transcript_14371/g.17437 Transcript_14371/m.17437 type:complete len:402 (+) Transcript_14371:101-1306(+)